MRILHVSRIWHCCQDVHQSSAFTLAVNLPNADDHQTPADAGSDVLRMASRKGLATSCRAS